MGPEETACWADQRTRMGLVKEMSRVQCMAESLHAPQLWGPLAPTPRTGGWRS